jgi:hypothetical protein
MMDKSRVVVTGVLFAMILAACGGSGGPGTFSTSIPGDRPLNSLSSSELATLCSDASKSFSSSGLKEDDCRLTGFLAASFQPSSATDPELQAVCAQATMSCLTRMPICPTQVPANCTATVAELTACDNDSAVQMHALASKLPACGGINRAAINANASVTTSQGPEPASCLSYGAKCGSSSSGDGGSGPPDAGMGQ